MLLLREGQALNMENEIVAVVFRGSAKLFVPTD